MFSPGPKLDSKEAGFTILEGMVSGALLVIVAVAMFPAFFALLNKSQVTNFKIQCNAMVKAKLQEYVTGAGAVAGSADGATSGLGAVPTGFEYARSRYQTVAGACSTNPDDFGFRETVVGNTLLADTAGTEAGLPGTFKGFQLWVNIQQYNPRVTTGSLPTLNCPVVATTATGLLNGYQFTRLGDAIEITVTGMIRTEPDAGAGGGGRGGAGAASTDPIGQKASYGGLRDLNWNQAAVNWKPNPELMCSLRQRVAAPSQMFRYFLGADGRIRRYIPGLAAERNNRSIAPIIESHYRSVWVAGTDPLDVDATIPIGNILSFAASPEQDTVYVLKPSVLIRYDNCNEADVVINGQTFPGVPDCRRSGPVVAVLTDINISGQNAQIESIAVDFGASSANTDDKIYGLRNSGPNADDREITKFDSADGLFKPIAVVAEKYQLPPIPRIKGILLLHSFPTVSRPELFVIDNTCYFGPGGVSSSSSYCVSIYGSGDVELDRIYGDLPLQVESVSN